VVLRDDNDDNFLWCVRDTGRNFDAPAQHVCSAGALGGEMIKRDGSAEDHIKHEKIGYVDILRLSGQFIGGQETDELRSVLRSVSEQRSSVLISAHANFVKRGGRIALAAISDSIRQVFVITKLDNVFEIFASEEEAIKSFTHS
jgi:hypothetical protein